MLDDAVADEQHLKQRLHEYLEQMEQLHGDSGQPFWDKIREHLRRLIDV